MHIVIQTLFGLNLGLLALDHLFTGILALFFPTQSLKTFQIIFGARIPESKEYFMILKPWGALGIFAGLIGILPILDPHKYALVLVVLVILLCLRIVYRLKYRTGSREFLKLEAKRNLIHVSLIAICAIVILIQLSTLT